MKRPPQTSTRHRKYLGNSTLLSLLSKATVSAADIFLERIMKDTLEDHEGTVSIGGRAITNLRFEKMR